MKIHIAALRVHIGVCLAAVCALAHAETELQVSAGAMGFSYKEYNDNGVLLDREDALLPGITAELGHRTGAWRISASGSFFSGTADYDGQTQAGVPAKTDTDEQLWSVGVRVERRFEIGTATLSPYVGFAYHEWQRDIKNGRAINNTPVTGLLEVYSWKTAELGALLRFNTGWERFEGAVDARAFRTVSPELQVRLPGATRDTVFELGEETGGRFALIGTYAFNPRLRLRLEAFYERWSFGRSPVVSGFLEPRSDTETTGLLLGLIHSF